MECLQKNLTDQLSRMEKDWDASRYNFDWSQIGGTDVFEHMERLVAESRAFVAEALVKTDVFRTAVLELDLTLRPRQKLSLTSTLEEARLWLLKFEAYLDWNRKVLSTVTLKTWKHLLENHLDADLAAMLSADDKITPTTGPGGGGMFCASSGVLVLVPGTGSS